MHLGDNGAAANARGPGELAPHLWVQANHDLRQPLQALVFMVRSLARGGDPAKVQETASYMEAALGGLQTKLDLLTELSRLECGAKVPTLRPCALAPMCQQVLPALTSIAAGHDITVRSRLFDANVLSDAQLLGLLVRSLALNAIKFASRGAVLMATRRHRQKINLDFYFGGPVIGEQQQKAAFVNVSPRDGAGVELGLGLGFIAHLARNLDHDVACKTLLEEGVCLSLAMPLA